MSGQSLGAVIALAVLGLIAVIAFSVAAGGAWRIAGTLAIALLLVAGTLPAITNKKKENNRC